MTVMPALVAGIVVLDANVPTSHRKRCNESFRGAPVGANPATVSGVKGLTLIWRVGFDECV
ncbi:hypothetical protein NP284_34635, partial [Rhodopseudomonas pseudopalustris]|uniref:hypothetical protein n=1 Tax=Rhodopseudomonas pseudopalustris TaxID=1513892 RepID=UPI003F9D9441